MKKVGTALLTTLFIFSPSLHRQMPKRKRITKHLLMCLQRHLWTAPDSFDQLMHRAQQIQLICGSGRNQ